MKTLLAVMLAVGLFSLTGQLAAQDTAVIFGTVFADSNANGIRDAGEAGIPDVIITVDADSAETGVNGYYSFTVAAPGTYGVMEVNPAGYISTTPDMVGVECLASHTYEVNFGDVEPVSAPMILGVIFEDLNRSGEQDANEAGIAGSIVELTLPGGSVSITTGSTGAYAFALAPGTYTLVETNVPEYLSTTPDTLTGYLNSGEVYQADFGDRMLAEVPLDIMPGACPNRMNSKGKKFLSVAIAGSATGEFTADEIDLATVRLEGIAPLSYSLKDVISPHEPFLGKQGCYDCSKRRSDGILDFEMSFDIDEIRTALGIIVTDSCFTLSLTGNFSDGFPFVGEDCLLLRVGGKPDVTNTIVPGPYQLSAQPNPVSDATTIRFTLPGASAVRVTVYDVFGREVAVVTEGFRYAGSQAVTWTGRNAAGQRVEGGIYFARIEAGHFTSTSKIAVLE